MDNAHNQLQDQIDRCCYNNNVVLERSLDAVHVIHRRHLCKSLTSRFWFRFADLAKHVNMTGLHSCRTCCSSLDLVLELQTFGSPVLCTCCSWTVSNKRCSQLCQIYHYEFKPGKKASANNQHGFNIPSLFWCQIMLSCFSFRTIALVVYVLAYAHHHNQHSVLVPDYAGESNTVRGLPPSPRQLKTGLKPSPLPQIVSISSSEK